MITQPVSIFLFSMGLLTPPLVLLSTETDEYIINAITFHIDNIIR